MVMEKVMQNDTACLTAYVADAEVGCRLYRQRPRIILAPGGAYLMHAAREKEGVALEFSRQGL